MKFEKEKAMNSELNVMEAASADVSKTVLEATLADGISIEFVEIYEGEDATHSVARNCSNG